MYFSVNSFYPPHWIKWKLHAQTISIQPKQKEWLQLYYYHLSMQESLWHSALIVVIPCVVWAKTSNPHSKTTDKLIYRQLHINVFVAFNVFFSPTFVKILCQTFEIIIIDTLNWTLECFSPWCDSFGSVWTQSGTSGANQTIRFWSAGKRISWTAYESTPERIISHVNPTPTSHGKPTSTCHIL